MKPKDAYLAVKTPPDLLISFIIFTSLAVFFFELKLFYVIAIIGLSYFLFRIVSRSIAQEKARYYHLFEEAAVCLAEQDLSRLKEFFERKASQEGVADWRAYFELHPKEIMHCASLIWITDINHKVLRLLSVTSKDQVPRTMDYYFTEHSLDAFKEELIALSQGATHWEGEIPVRSLKGKLHHQMFQLSVMPGYEKSLSRVIVSITDVTEQKKVQKTLHLNEERLRQIIDLVPHFIFAKDIEGRFILVNQAVANAYGTTIEGLIGKKDSDFSKSQEEVDHFREDDMQVIYSNQPKFIPEETITTAKGEKKLLSTTKIPFVASGVETPCILGVSVDITTSKKTEEALIQSRHFVDSILNATPDLIYIYDLVEKQSVYLNREALEFLGYQAEQIQWLDESTFTRLIHPQDCPKLVLHHKKLVKEGEVRQVEYRIKDAQGQWRWLRSRDVVFSRTPQGKPWQILGSAEDVTERKYLENRLIALAHYDSLTTFPNRALFYERAGVGLAHARRHNTSCAVLFVDLDHFKAVNDNLGHSVGDELLRDAANRLAECVRESDTIARIGGDEFIVFLNGLDSVQSVQYIAERIREKFNTPRDILGHDLFVTASVGIATYPHDGNSLEDLLKNSDIAMYAAKQSGGNSYCFFDGIMNRKAADRMQLERGLRDALSKSELQLFYQPIVGVKDHKVRGFEALLRWMRSDGVYVSPADFIAIAEETGMIISIGHWVLKEACRFGRKLYDQGFDQMIISVNISVAQLRRRALIDAITEALDETGLPAHCLEIEVTESICIDSFDTSIETLNQIHEMGVRISLDDFGTGYSSFSHLQRLPITNLKIDRLFIQELGEEGSKAAMALAMIDLAHTLELDVIAEGVEDDRQLKRLMHERCDYFQGYLSAKPMPEAQAIEFLHESRV